MKKDAQDFNPFAAPPSVSQPKQKPEFKSETGEKLILPPPPKPQGKPEFRSETGQSLILPPPPPPKSSIQSQPPAPEKPVEKGISVSSKHSKAVEEMQQQLINIGNFVKGDNFKQLLTNKKEINFLLDRKIKNENIKKDLNTISNDMISVGKRTQYDFSVPDGIWGGQTTLGLMSAVNLAFATATLSQDLNIQQQDYTLKDAEELKSQVPANTLSSEEINTVASNLSSALNKLYSYLTTTFINSLSEHKLSNKDILPITFKKQIPQQFVSGDIRGMLSSLFYTNEKATPLSVPKELNNKKENNIGLTFNNIKDLSAFKKYLEQNNITVGGQKSWTDKKLVDKVIDHMLSLL